MASCRLIIQNHGDVVAIEARVCPHVQVEAGRIDPDEHHWGKTICAGMTVDLVRRETKQRFRLGHIALLDQSGL